MEILHGHAIADPHRWLEPGDDAAVARWAEEQNQSTRAVLDSLPGRGAIRRRLEQLLSIGYVSAPTVRGRRHFMMRRDGFQNHGILYMREGLEGVERVVLDPNTWSTEGTRSLDWWYPDPDGRLVAYGMSEAGDERSTLRVRQVDEGTDLEDAIPHTRSASVAWCPRQEGFYYARYPAPGTVPQGEESYHRRIWHHTLGTPADEDVLVFGEGRDPQDWPDVDISLDGRYLWVTVQRGWVRTDVYVKDLAGADPLGGDGWLTVAEGEDNQYVPEVVNGILYLMTNAEAPRWRLLRMDLARPGEPREVVAQHATRTLVGYHVAGGRLLLHSTEKATSRLDLHDSEGRFLRAVELPALGSVGGITGRSDGDELFYEFDSFIVPPTVYRYDLRTDECNKVFGVEATLDASAYDVRQVEYPSKDGTIITMFLVHKQGIRLDGSNPTLLTGYGGFNIAMTPGFHRGTFLLLERGVVYALPNLRGGGEYGEDWHRAGMLGNKQNVFDDFLAAAGWLMEEGYTCPDRLAISGGSNGGLLVGAALTQAPELFRAVVCSVPLLDMLRYHLFRIARLWTPEYGCADDPEQFRWLHEWSPYHRVEKGRAYPAVLLVTGESDSRVDPMHARKMAAALQEATSSGLPVLLRSESKAGHGAGKPLSKVLDEMTDTSSFILWQLKAGEAVAST